MPTSPALAARKQPASVSILASLPAVSPTRAEASTISVSVMQRYSTDAWKSPYCGRR